MRTYTAIFSAVAVSAAQDLFELLAAAGKPVQILGFSLSQSSDLGDAAAEGLTVRMKRWVGGTAGSVGSTATPTPLNKSMATAGAVVKVNNTTQAVAGEGSLTIFGSWGWNIAQMLNVRFDRGEARDLCPVVAPTDRWILDIAGAPADAITVSGTLYFAELPAWK